jgi:hypothetical protein
LWVSPSPDARKFVLPVYESGAPAKVLFKKAEQIELLNISATSRRRIFYMNNTTSTLTTFSRAVLGFLLVPLLLPLSACYSDPLWNQTAGSNLDPAALADVVAQLPHREALDEVAEHYDLPADLLEVMGWVGSSWSQVDHEHHPGLDAHGPLALTDAQLARASELTGLSGLEIAADPAVGLVAGAALLDDLRKEHSPSADVLFFDARWWPVLMAWSGTGENWLDATYAWDVFATLQRGLSVETGLGELVFVAARVISGLQDIALPDGPGQSEERDDSGGPVGYPGRAQFLTATNSSTRPGGVGAIDSIVIHTSEGSYTSCINWFTSPGNDVSSAHYVVRRSDGEVTQFVSDDRKAWHGTNYNSRSIGIEHEGAANNAANWTEAILEGSARLSAWASTQYNIPVDRDHFIGHSEVPGSGKSDPGAYFPWDRYLALVTCFKTGASDCTEGESAPGVPGDTPDTPDDPGAPSGGDSGSGDDSPSGSEGSGSDSSGGSSTPAEWVRIVHPTTGMPVGDPTEIIARRGGGDRIEFWAGAALIGEASASNPAITSIDFVSHGNRTIMARLVSAWGTVLAVDTVRVEVQSTEGAIRPFGSPAGGMRWTIGAELDDLEDAAYVTYSVDGFSLTDDNSGESEFEGPDFALNYTFEVTGHGRVLVARAYDADGEFLAHGVSYIDVEESTTLECAIRDTLSCGQEISGNTTTDASSTDRLDSYADIVGVWNGPEVGYELGAASSGEIELELLYDGPVEIDHDLILLKRDVGVCAAADAIQVGYTSLSFEPDPGATYTLVVDGYNGAEGEYSVRMTCL